MANAPKNIYAALAAAQAEMTRAKKDSNNPHFRSKFADLASVQDACFPALNKHGFAVFQPLVKEEDGLAVQTILAHESGEMLQCSIPLILAANNMQGLGSAITYARRYGLFCMSGVAPDDDDGNEASKQAPKKQVKPAPPAEKAPPEVPEKVQKRLEAITNKIKTIEDLDEYVGFADGIRNEVLGLRTNGFAEIAAEISGLMTSKKAELETAPSPLNAE